MYLTVTPIRQHASEHGDIWYKEIFVDYVPNVGEEEVVLWSFEDTDPDDGPAWYVRSRRMAPNGNWYISLAEMLVDPSEQDEGVLKRTIANGGPYHHHGYWRTDLDGDPIPHLIRAGWKKCG